MKRPIYSFFNIIYQIIAFWLLFMANAYYNDQIVPDSLMWQDNNRRMDKSGLLGYAGVKFIALLIEAAIVIAIIYAINRAVLSVTEGKADRNLVANKTAKWHMMITACFILILIWGSFRGYLW